MSSLILYREHNNAKEGHNHSNILQNEAFNKLFHLISMQLQTVENFSLPSQDALSHHHTHQAILIEGGRGSGKTTFLLNALHALDGKEAFTNEQKQAYTFPDDLSKKSHDLAGKVCVLPIIDPTLIETKQHIIIVIIAMIDKILDRHCSPMYTETDQYKEVDKAREDMAEGLTLIDGIGRAEPYGEANWEDPLWIMSTGLRKAKKGSFFEKAFQNYIHHALKVLNKKIFILAFDDIDTNFEHGRSILEAIRKYLTTPQLVLIISGDLDLYGRLVRSSIYDTLGKNILDHDNELMGGSATSLSRAVWELEEQYLLKIIPPQNRIAMLPLSGIIQQTRDGNKDIICIKNTYDSTNDEDKNKNDIAFKIDAWVSKHINRLLLNGHDTTPHPFFDIISREHLRIVIDYLYALDNETTTTARQAVQKVFEARLRHAGIDVQHLAYTTAEDTRFTVFRWLAGQDAPASLGLFGVPNDSRKAVIVHCLALALAQELDQSLYAAFRTLLTVNLPIQMMQRGDYTIPRVRTAMVDFLWSDTGTDSSLFEIIARIGSISRLESISNKQTSIGTTKASCFGSVGILKKPRNKLSTLGLMFGFTVSGQDASLRNIHVGHFQPNNTASGNSPNNTKPNNGDNPPPGFKLKDNNKKNGQPIYLSREWLSDVEATAPLEAAAQPFTNRAIERGIAWFTIGDIIARSGKFGDILKRIYYKRYALDGAEYDSISAFSLFAAIVELLRNDLSPDSFMDELFKKRNRLDTVPAFSINDNNEITNSTSTPLNEDDEDDKDDDVSSDDAGNDDSFNDFVKKIKEWRESSKEYFNCSRKKDDFHISPTMLGEIANQIHAQLISLDTEVRENWQTGLILQRQITNILHVLITATSNSQYRVEAPKHTDEPLIRALNRTTKESPLHPLAASVLSCPLIWIFLPPTDRKGGRTPLYEAAKNALITSNFPTKEHSIDDFLTPPSFNILISRIRPKRNNDTVKQTGFFKILNVVPRYYHSSK